MTGAMPRLALFEPDIPQNTGTILRLCACLGVPVEIVEPAGFDVSDRHFRRSGLDYLERAAVTRHPSWVAFEAWRRGEGARLVVATTRGPTLYTAYALRRCTGRRARGSSCRCGRACARLTWRLRPR
jgi:tRNA (cytidine/uridine-2'-O-)-methyltransferase